MRKFLMAWASAALLIFGFATEATAATENSAVEYTMDAATYNDAIASAAVDDGGIIRYTGYYYGLNNPSELAALIEESLRQDPTGRTMLNAAKCRQDGSCGAPINYLESFQDKDPHGGWTLENMAQNLRSLVIDCEVEGVYQMDRIRVVGNASLGETDLNGMSRTFEDDCAWVNPSTGRPVLARRCTNPVGQRIDIVCVYVNVEVRDPSERELIWQRRVREDDECFAYRRVDAVYTPDSPSARWQEVPRDCVDRPCDFTAVNQVLGDPAVVAQGTIPVQPGIYQVRLSPDEYLVLCLKRFLGRDAVSSSFANGVRWDQDYLRLVGRERHARVYYESNEFESNDLEHDEAGALAFYASDVEDERIMQAGSTTP